MAVVSRTAQWTLTLFNATGAFIPEEMLMLKRRDKSLDQYVGDFRGTSSLPMLLTCEV